MSAESHDIHRLALDMSERAADVSEKLLEAEQKYEALQQALHELQQMEIVGSAADDGVQVTLNGFGRVTKVYISPRAQSALSETALGESVLAAIKAGKDEVARHAKEKIEAASANTIPDVDDVQMPDDPLADLRRATAGLHSTQIPGVGES